MADAQIERSAGCVVELVRSCFTGEERRNHNVRGGSDEPFDAAR